MRVWLVALVIVSRVALGQEAMNEGPCKMDGSDCSTVGGGSDTFESASSTLTIDSAAGVHTFSLNVDLEAFGAFFNGSASNSRIGVIARTASQDGDEVTIGYSARSLVGTNNEICVSNGKGISGNPTFSLCSELDLSSKTVRVPNGTSFPGACVIGDSFMKTDATSGQRWYLCESSNTWVVQGGGGGGGAPVGVNGQIQAYDDGNFGAAPGMIIDLTTATLDIDGGQLKSFGLETNSWYHAAVTTRLDMTDEAHGAALIATGLHVYTELQDTGPGYASSLYAAIMKENGANANRTAAINSAVFNYSDSNVALRDVGLYAFTYSFPTGSATVSQLGVALFGSAVSNTAVATGAGVYGESSGAATNYAFYGGLGFNFFAGNTAIGGTVREATTALDVVGVGRLDQLVVTTSASPASNAACTAGRFVWDSSYLYLCTASGAWKRAALTGGY